MPKVRKTRKYSDVHTKTGVLTNTKSTSNTKSECSSASCKVKKKVSFTDKEDASEVTISYKSYPNRVVMLKQMAK